MQKTLTCPRCHQGCNLNITYFGRELTSVLGHKCPTGVEFAQQSLGVTKTTVSTSVRIQGSVYPLLSVRTDKPVDKTWAMKILQEAATLTLEAPIRNGQTIARNVAGSGVNLIATKAADLA